MLPKAAKTSLPVLRQIICSGYVFSFQLPRPFVNYLGCGFNYSFLKTAHQACCKKADLTSQDLAECMATTKGPSAHECRTRTTTGETYPESVQDNRWSPSSTFNHMTSYYRDGAVRARWEKSLETIAYLHSLNSSYGNRTRRYSSGAGVFDEGPEGVLKSSSTIVWGMEDVALEPHLCLDGISDYLVSDSQVVKLPRSGHTTAMEGQSRDVLEGVIRWSVKGEKEDVGGVVRRCYPDAVVSVRR